MDRSPPPDQSTVGVRAKLLELCCATLPAGLVGAGVLLLTSPAHAYPYFIGLQQGTCGDCHYSPTGGGLINEWGRSTRGVTWGGQDEWSLHSDVRGYDSGQARLQADAGGDARLLAVVPLNAHVGAPALVVPMLLELQGVMAYGPWELYAGVTPRPGTPSRPYVVFSREHWLLYRARNDVTLRLGRLVLPFGIRTPDHTQYVRQDFGFDKWDQSDAFEVDISSPASLMSVAAFVGDLTVPAERQERGGVIRASFNLADERGWWGASLLAARSEARDRINGSVFAGVRALDRGYVLAELATQKLAAQHQAAILTTSAAFLRVGWFWADAVDSFAEVGYRRIADQPALTLERGTVGTNWQLFSWCEFIPTLQVERATGRSAEWALLAQFHLMH
jgi:hypothetical protein